MQHEGRSETLNALVRTSRQFFAKPRRLPRSSQNPCFRSNLPRLQNNHFLEDQKPTSRHPVFPRLCLILLHHVFLTIRPTNLCYLKAPRTLFFTSLLKMQAVLLFFERDRNSLFTVCIHNEIFHGYQSVIIDVYCSTCLIFYQGIAVCVSVFFFFPQRSGVV